ncbi:MAG: hypothetical protein ACREH8_04845 [Opitutaceae bacterium]
MEAALGERQDLQASPPDRNPPNGWGGIGGNGRNDNGGNRNERFLACIACLDGVRPSGV